MKNVNKNLLGILLFGVAFLVAGVIFTLIQLWGDSEMAAFTNEAQDVLVVKVEPETVTSHKKKRTVYRPYFRFTDENGEEHVGKCVDTYPSNKYPEGTHVSILYDPNDPENRVIIKGTETRASNSSPVSWGLLGIGAIGCVVGLVAIGVDLARKRLFHSGGNP